MKTEYNLNILQSVESDKEILDKEWKSLKWNSIKYSIFKIQKRIFKAEKEGLTIIIVFLSYKLCSSRMS
jgi:hypothetical protein